MEHLTISLIALCKLNNDFQKNAVFKGISLGHVQDSIFTATRLEYPVEKVLILCNIYSSGQIGY